jgi:uncharacterized membrane protein YccC
VGPAEGWLLGCPEGRWVLVGVAVLGTAVGAGDTLGAAVGQLVGCLLGCALGCEDGWLLGRR